MQKGTYIYDRERQEFRERLQPEVSASRPAFDAPLAEPAQTASTRSSSRAHPKKEGTSWRTYFWIICGTIIIVWFVVMVSYLRATG